MKKSLFLSGVLCSALGVSSVGITADLQVDSSSTSLERQSEYYVAKPDAPKPGEMVSVIVKLDVDSVAAFAGRSVESAGKADIPTEYHRSLSDQWDWLCI